MRAEGPRFQARGAEMSIVLVTDRYATIRDVVLRLRAQTVRDRLELIIVGPSREALEPAESELDGFAGVVLIEIGSISPLARGLAAGVRAASAPLVQLGETHALPAPDWAEALIRAHAGPWAIVVPGVGNGNPDGAISWTNVLLDYGQFMDVLPGREIGHTPTHNPAFRRDLLLGFGDRLEEALSGGYEISVDWQAQGHRFYFEPSARVEHMNVSRPSCWLPQRYVVGRVHAAERSRHWSPLRRFLYACASPLIPAVVLWRVLPAVRVLRRQRRLPPRTLPALVLGALVAALGELIGYAGGAREADKQRLDEYELHKTRFLRTPILVTEGSG